MLGPRCHKLILYIAPVLSEVRRSLSAPATTVLMSIDATSGLKQGDLLSLLVFQLFFNCFMKRAVCDPNQDGGLQTQIQFPQ